MMTHNGLNQTIQCYNYTYTDEYWLYYIYIWLECIHQLIHMHHAIFLRTHTRTHAHTHTYTDTLNYIYIHVYMSSPSRP